MHAAETVLEDTLDLRYAALSSSIFCFHCAALPAFSGSATVKGSATFKELIHIGSSWPQAVQNQVRLVERNEMQKPMNRAKAVASARRCQWQSLRGGSHLDFKLEMQDRHNQGSSDHETSCMRRESIQDNFKTASLEDRVEKSLK
jgi:hypothetical protein